MTTDNDCRHNGYCELCLPALEIAMALEGSIRFTVPAEIAAIDDPNMRGEAIDDWLNSGNSPLIGIGPHTYAEAVSLGEWHEVA
tara:strand:+ start:503 stop:754 length:252 start_codon:yes stop_codon:yes gene_type:complete